MASPKELKNKPLREAIFELRWLLEKQGDLITDPHYKVLIGELYGKIKSDYPYHEKLPASFLPDEAAAYILQHRFRRQKDAWPLVQIGPGMITLNETEGYKWKDFEKRVIKLIENLFKSYPQDNQPKTTQLVLRYINDIELKNEQVLELLKEEMDINLELKEGLFKDVKKDVAAMDVNFSFNCSKPKGIMQIRLAKGKRDEKSILSWEHIMKSPEEQTFKSKKEIDEWLQAAHTLIEEWFFTLIDGKLAEKFDT